MNTETPTAKESVAEVILIVNAVKRHLLEQNCPHSIDTIVKDALEGKGSGAHHSTQEAQEPVIQRNPNDRDKVNF